MGLVWDHLRVTMPTPGTKGTGAERKRGFYLANELAHTHVKRRVFRESDRQTDPLHWS